MSKTAKKWISPIAIDLGAKNTGVYYAHYQAGSCLEGIEKEGRVYQLEKDAYTLLMVNRTAIRHQRRGFDRRQMVKRLFKLIWEKYKLSWDKNVQQSVSFLLNRRGFTFLMEEYNTKILSQFPKEVYKLLPDEVKEGVEENQEDGGYDFDSTLKAWSREGEDKVRTMLKALEEKINVAEKDSVWNFKKKSNKDEPAKKLEIIKFKVETAEFNQIDELAESASKKDKEKYKKDIWNLKKTHLHHLTFAIKKTLDELESGSRHRSKYFAEIKSVLENQNHTHNYLKNFCGDLHSKKYKPLNAHKLTHLIGHLSNFELKPLRKYFNNEKHKNDDYWDEAFLSKLFDRWILREWRVNPEKDKDKAKGKSGDYEKLKKKWKDYKADKPKTVIDFWLSTCPLLTIPPYQDNNNRRPPRCQSLILNPMFLDLDKKYPQWQNWLGKLKALSEVKYLGNFEEELKELKGGKGKPYFDTEIKCELKKDKKNSGYRTKKDLDARILQFIFDRVKNDDLLKLNEIYSHAKKIKQLKRDLKQDGGQKTKDELENTKKKLEKTIEHSKLVDDLKTDINFQRDGIFTENSFLHLVCKYYKLRQKAKDGRLFIHPEYRYIKGKGRGYESTGRFDDKDHLLTYCNHKSRQKRYQTLNDLAGLLQVSPQKLEQHVQEQDGKTIDEKILHWLNGVEHLKINCEKSSKEQKDRRGSLKLDIQNIYSLIYYNKDNHRNLSDQKIKEVLKRSKVEEAFKLYNFCEKSKKLSQKITCSLYDPSKQEEWQKRLEKNPASAFYFLSQMHNIAFKDRSGNSSTCAVCSMDNAQRMKQVQTNNIKKELHAKAQTLPAISTRLIDGAVMRLARIVGDAIAEDKWKKIQEDIEEGHKVHIPIITESNRFEFEPSKEELVKSHRQKPRKGKALERSDQKTYDETVNKINQDSNKTGICPYTGELLGDNGGEIDHIIPRTSSYGTLNDEANLIYVSKKGNQAKSNQQYLLADLHNEYKKKQFNTTDDREIEEWIIDQIGNGEDGDFKFGQYRSFINLNLEEQKAFRHALFLKGHSLREKVIRAIDNRTRTFVNGTQRYFAEVLANRLYKKAKALKKQELLSFDYFGVEAQSNSRGDGISDLRKDYEKIDSDIKKYSKDGNQQEPYSHLIDAQLAFAIIADVHKKEGSLKLNIDDSTHLRPMDKGTGEAFDNIFDKIKIEQEDLEIIDLKRRKPRENFSSHRSFTRDTFYADHYLPILLKKCENKIQVKVGFDWKNSANFPVQEKKSLGVLKEIIPMCKHTEILKDLEFSNLENLYDQISKVYYFQKQIEKYNYFYLNIDKYKLHKYLMQFYSTSISRSCNLGDIERIFKFCYKQIGYRTEKITINKPSQLEQEEKKFEINVNGKIILPAKMEWKRCQKEWERLKQSKKWKQQEEKEEFNKFLTKHFLCNKREKNKKVTHQKVRKAFSLPVVTGQGKLLLKRKSWNGGLTYQIVNDSDSRSPDNKPNIPIRMQDGGRGKKLAKWARSKNIVKLSTSDKYQDGECINPEDWWLVDKQRWLNSNQFNSEDEIKWPDGIDKIWYRIDDDTAPSIALKLGKDGKELKSSILEHSLCKHGFRKQKKKKATKNSEAIPEKSADSIRDEFFEREVSSAHIGKTISYKGAAYKKEMNEAFKLVSNQACNPFKKKNETSYN